MSLNFFFPEKSPAADVDNAESPRGSVAIRYAEEDRHKHSLRKSNSKPEEEIRRRPSTEEVWRRGPAPDGY